ncbi:hypothetical protein Vadar_032396 [Vaccinium darrowii]|uniref:Uncharacterized protein n=1 Tax=Vaccinium darrowii TaxID=229202 RepID=A0ACB7YA03_9ERIC|nr:hypothetical protein Vadar_032396 [Vaccinium darrowii]
MYSQMLCGLFQNNEVLLVGAIFASGFIRTIRFLEKHWPLLCNDIRTGTLNPLITDPLVREAVTRILEPDPKLADFIEGECRRESSRGIITRLWPNTYQPLRSGAGICFSLFDLDFSQFPLLPPALALLGLVLPPLSGALFPCLATPTPFSLLGLWQPVVGSMGSSLGTIRSQRAWWLMTVGGGVVLCHFIAVRASASPCSTSASPYFPCCHQLGSLGPWFAAAVWCGVSLSCYSDAIFTLGALAAGGGFVGFISWDNLVCSTALWS